VLLLILVPLLLLLCGGGAGAQEPASPPPKADETTYALSWLQGRFLAPVTCIRRDGSRVELEESISIRPGPKRSGLSIIRITFFGIDVPDAEKCFSIVEPRVPDRRGVLYVTYRSNRRPDMGLADFRRAFKKEALRYHIVGGELRFRELGAEGAQVIRFGKGDHPLLVRRVQKQSDAHRLLADYEKEDAAEPDRRRRLVFHIEGPDGFTYEGAFIEAQSRWR
jgi:hypothetical protein